MFADLLQCPEIWYTVPPDIDASACARQAARWLLKAHRMAGANRGRRPPARIRSAVHPSCPSLINLLESARCQLAHPCRRAVAATLSGCRVIGCRDLLAFCRFCQRRRTRGGWVVHCTPIPYCVLCRYGAHAEYRSMHVTQPNRKCCQISMNHGSMCSPSGGRVRNFPKVSVQAGVRQRTPGTPSYVSGMRGRIVLDNRPSSLVPGAAKHPSGQGQASPGLARARPNADELSTDSNDRVVARVRNKNEGAVTVTANGANGNVFELGIVRVCASVPWSSARAVRIAHLIEFRPPSRPLETVQPAQQFKTLLH